MKARLDGPSLPVAKVSRHARKHRRRHYSPDLCHPVPLTLVAIGRG